MTKAVFLARMQPPHNAHFYPIKRACLENDEVYIILGSANKEDTLRNPFSVDLRKEILLEVIENELGKEYSDKIRVFELPDWSMENDIPNAKEWGSYLYYNIVSRIGTKSFTMYYSDEPDIMLNWFNEDILKRIDFAFLDRDHIFDNLSATKIREAFAQDNMEYIKEFCPEAVIKRYDLLRDIWLGVRENQKSDFSME